MNVSYYYKPKTKYPPRIYLFYDIGQWNQRNFRPMGLQSEFHFPLLTREMTRFEIEENEDCWRMIYYQYENWNRLLKGELRAEVPIEFIENQLLPLHKKYKLDGVLPKDLKLLMKQLKEKEAIQLQIFSSTIN